MEGPEEKTCGTNSVEATEKESMDNVKHVDQPVEETTAAAEPEKAQDVAGAIKGFPSFLYKYVVLVT